MSGEGGKWSSAVPNDVQHACLGQNVFPAQVMFWEGDVLESPFKMACADSVDNFWFPTPPVALARKFGKMTLPRALHSIRRQEGHVSLHIYPRLFEGCKVMTARDKSSTQTKPENPAALSSQKRRSYRKEGNLKKMRPTNPHTDTHVITLNRHTDLTLWLRRFCLDSIALRSCRTLCCDTF